MSNENENQDSGLPTDAGIKSPYLEGETNKAPESSEDNKNEPKSLVPVFIFIGVFIAIICIAVVIASKYLGGANEDTKVSLETKHEATTKVAEVIEVDDNLPPPLTRIADNTVENITSSYEIDSPSDIDSQSLKQSDEIISLINTLVNRVETLESLVKAQNALLSSTKSNTDSIADKSNAIISSTEVIASKLNSQYTQFELVKNQMVSEKEMEKVLATRPPFRVAARSLWGDVVYLTVATENNFEQQAIVGGIVSGWTLSKVDLKNKLSYWKNTQGDTHELLIP